ncbi:hypothetical protein [Vibrio gangliei]|uniref:hypothetical protein n=1 Tax=Vibrio gangliei TaxID=2077090 RepID=UPI000D01D6E2|nr:hypothetical protein [Vibrio gangliei]
MDLLVTPVEAVFAVSLLGTVGVYLIYLVSALCVSHALKFTAISGLYALALVYFIHGDLPVLASVTALAYVKSVSFLFDKAKRYC